MNVCVHMSLAATSAERLQSKACMRGGGEKRKLSSLGGCLISFYALEASRCGAGPEQPSSYGTQRVEPLLQERSQALPQLKTAAAPGREGGNHAQAREEVALILLTRLACTIDWQVQSTSQRN